MLRNWERGREYRQLAAFYGERKVSGEAARYLKLAGDHAAAAVEFRRAGLAGAGGAGVRAGTAIYKRAAALYRRLGDSAALLRCLGSMHGGGAHEAALVYEGAAQLAEERPSTFRRYADRLCRRRAPTWSGGWRPSPPSAPACGPPCAWMRSASTCAPHRSTSATATCRARRGAVSSAGGAPRSRRRAAWRPAGRPTARRRSEALRSSGEERSSGDEAVGHAAVALDPLRGRPTLSRESRATPDKQVVAYAPGELVRAAGRLARSGEHRPALAHYLALRASCMPTMTMRFSRGVAGRLRRPGSATARRRPITACGIECPGRRRTPTWIEHPEAVLPVAEVEAACRSVPDEDARGSAT